MSWERVATIESSFLLVSLNKLLGWHWKRKSKEKDAWDWVVRTNIQKPKTPCQGKARVIVTRFLSKGEREWDIDNLVAGSAKQLIDRLVHSGWLADDTPKLCEREYRQDSSRRASPGTRVEIDWWVEGGAG